ncbi:MAG: YggU family protein [Lentisphaerae bacterium]|nr:MAG: YggU family protein [Lentisphaerota bacterium]
MASFIQTHKDGVCISVQVKPQCSRTGVLGIHDGHLVIGLKSPPVEGKANTELIKYLAKYFDLPRIDVEIINGTKNRRKTVLLAGKTKDELLRKLENITA